MSQCQTALTNLLQRISAETEASARLLEKQERIEAITASLRASGGSEVKLMLSWSRSGQGHDHDQVRITIIISKLYKLIKT